jgi:multidrug efflux pump subunit AcrA (membrane-fusion protein)
MALSRKVRRYRGWIALAVLLAVGGTAFAITRAGGDEAPETTYTTETAAPGTLSVTVSGTGNLEIDGTTDVYPDIAGTVESIEVAEGDIVTTGTVLFTLGDSEVESSIDKAYASYRQAKQGVAQAQGQLLKAKASLEELAERSDDPSATVAVSDADIEAAELEVESAQLSVESAKASQSSAWTEYETAKEARDDLEVVSPASGVVYSLGIDVGDAVSATGGGSGSDSASATSQTGATTSDPPVVIAPEQPLAVHLTVNEVDLPALAIGQRADVEFDALTDVTATGKVYEISDEGANEQGVVTFDVWVSLDVANEALRAGMSAAATIVTQIAKDALLVPNGAVKTDSDGSYYVEVLREGATTPEQVAVEVGLSNATQTQIVSGLTQGDPVVTTTSTSSDSSSEDGEDSRGFEGPGGGMMVPGMGGGPQ